MPSQQSIQLTLTRYPQVTGTVIDILHTLFLLIPTTTPWNMLYYFLHLQMRKEVEEQSLLPNITSLICKYKR